ncbi:MAG: mechanosensitive ion channel family protein [Proteobacteria bacterium]|nr:mechanosensitive ion channel family protein [Pseudomonadota bacterium]NDC23822.1 mechanosensitive ion channel family protein [Pseudomonadota bacterium]NDD03882.1 mechanosensitive ion channel family protein [Pseudomonadota bacterium]NDG26411.1 mechanosensitive ion channel family protein [Pseudomonadota bacterium]
MMNYLSKYETLAWPLGIASGVLLFLLLLRGLFFRYLGPKANHSSTHFRDTALSLIKTPSIYWCVAIAIYLGIAFADISPRNSRPLNVSIEVILILSVTLVCANIAATVFTNLVTKEKRTAPVSGLSIGVIRAIVLIPGVVLVLTIMGVSITPILGALGVGGLAVALALKDTLENLFAGIYLIWDRTIRVGDYVKLENGTEGEVDDIDWRSTRIRTNANSSVIVPNSKVAQSAITNYCLPEKRVTTTLNIFLTLDSDTDLAEKILIDEARRGSEDIVGLLANPSPQVRFGTPAPEAALQLQLIFQVREFQDQGFVLHELRKRIYRQFKKSGISLYQRNFA